MVLAPEKWCGKCFTKSRLATLPCSHPFTPRLDALFEDESEEKLLGYHRQKWNELGLKCKEDLQKRIFQMHVRGQCDDAFDPNDELVNNEWCKYVRGIEKYAGTSPDGSKE